MPGERDNKRARFDLVMFDLDGTLVDTAPEITDAVNAYLAQRGQAPVSAAEIRNRIGHGARRLLAAVLGHEPDDIEWREFTRRYLQCCGRNSSVYPHAHEALAGLRNEGVKLAVVTNKEQRFTQPVLHAHGLLAAFDLVVCGDNLPRNKPDPLPLRHCLEQLGLSEAQALYVGDSEIDVLTARNAGIAIWAVPYGYNGGRLIELAQPNRIIPDLSALFELRTITSGLRA